MSPRKARGVWGPSGPSEPPPASRAAQLSATPRTVGAGGSRAPASAPLPGELWGWAQWRRGPLPCPPASSLATRARLAPAEWTVVSSGICTARGSGRAPASWLSAVPRSAPSGLGAVPGRVLWLGVRGAGGCCSTMLRHRRRDPQESCRRRCEPLHSGGTKGLGGDTAGRCPHVRSVREIEAPGRSANKPPGVTGPRGTSPRGHCAAILRTRHRSPGGERGAGMARGAQSSPPPSPTRRRGARSRTGPTEPAHGGRVAPRSFGVSPSACLERRFHFRSCLLSSRRPLCRFSPSC